MTKGRTWSYAATGWVMCWTHQEKVRANLRGERTARTRHAKARRTGQARHTAAKYERAAHSTSQRWGPQGKGKTGPRLPKGIPPENEQRNRPGTEAPEARAPMTDDPAEP